MLSLENHIKISLCFSNTHQFEELQNVPPFELFVAELIRIVLQTPITTCVPFFPTAGAVIQVLPGSQKNLAQGCFIFNDPAYLTGTPRNGIKQDKGRLTQLSRIGYSAPSRSFLLISSAN